MSRETKVGVLVSCAFLCLVGVVLATKLTEGAHSANAAAEGDGKPAPEPRPGSIAPATSAEVANLHKTPDTKLPVQRAVATEPGGQSEPAGPGGFGDPPARVKDAAPPPEGSPSDGFPPPMPMPGGPATEATTGGTVVSTPADAFPPADPMAPAKDDKIKPDGPKEPATAPDPKKTGDESPMADPFKRLPNDSPDGAPAPPPPDPMDMGRKDSPDPRKSLDPDKKSESVAPQVKPKDGPPADPLPPATPTDDPFKIKDPPPPVVKPVESPALSRPERRLPAVGLADPRKTTPAAPEQPVESVRPFDREAVRDVRPSVPSAPVSIQERPAAAVAMPAPLPERPKSLPTVAPEPRRGPASLVAEVDSYDEEIHRSAAGETFERLSERYYQSDKYARALLQFNRDHPQAGNGMRQSPPVLAGQTLFIPPLYILRKHHAALIDEARVERPVERPVAPAIASPSPAGLPQTGSTRSYEVRGASGESMQAIARTLLGDGERWRDIARLNPGFRNDLPIPTGAVIKLPGDAAVPQ